MCKQQKDKSAKKPRRRTIATPSPRQLVLGRRLLAGDSNTGDSAVRKSKQYTEEDDEEDSGGEDEALDDGGWENWNGVRVVSHRVSLKDGWKDMKSTSDEGGDGGERGVWRHDLRADRREDLSGDSRLGA